MTGRIQSDLGILRGTTDPARDANDYIETNPDDYASRIMAALISDYELALYTAEMEISDLKRRLGYPEFAR